MTELKPSDIFKSSDKANAKTKQELISEDHRIGRPKIMNYELISKLLLNGKPVEISNGFKGYSIVGEALLESIISLEHPRREVDPLYLLPTKSRSECKDLLKDGLISIQEEVSIQLINTTEQVRENFIIMLADIGNRTDDKFYNMHGTFVNLLGYNLTATYKKYAKLLEVKQDKSKYLKGSVLVVLTKAYQKLKLADTSEVDNQLIPLIVANLIKSDYISVNVGLDVAEDLHKLSYGEDTQYDIVLALLIANSAKVLKQLYGSQELFVFAAEQSYINFVGSDGNKELASTIFLLLNEQDVYFSSIRELKLITNSSYQGLNEKDFMQDFNLNRVYEILDEYLQN